MAGTSFQVLQPSAITLPPHVQTIAVINRYKPERGGSKALNIIEGILTGEMIGTDKAGSKSAVMGMIQGLSLSPRIKVVEVPYEILGSGTGYFPDRLNPEEVSRICKQQGAQALVALEAFDHDISRSIVKNQEKIKDKGGNMVTRDVFSARKLVRMKVGWRIYQADNGAIIDEHTMFNQMNFERRDANQFQAMAMLPSSMDCVPQVGNAAGRDYATRVAPYWTTLHRSYYKKGKSANISAGARNAEFQEWENAASKWIQDVDHPDPKTSARACYNMAVASEALGRNEVARDYARKAYDKHPKSKYRNYVYVIEQRIADAQKLDEQMAPVEGRP